MIPCYICSCELLPKLDALSGAIHLSDVLMRFFQNFGMEHSFS